MNREQMVCHCTKKLGTILYSEGKIHKSNFNNDSVIQCDAKSTNCCTTTVTSTSILYLTVTSNSKGVVLIKDKIICHF